MGTILPKSLQRLKSTARASGVRSSDGRQSTIFEMSLVVTSRFGSSVDVSFTGVDRIKQRRDYRCQRHSCRLSADTACAVQVVCSHHQGCTARSREHLLLEMDPAMSLEMVRSTLFASCPAYFVSLRLCRGVVGFPLSASYGEQP